MGTQKQSTRLGHKKSRNGCLRCKARRVKCDERRPCSNCIRHEVQCSLLSETNTASPAVANSPAPSASGISNPELLNSQARGPETPAVHDEGWSGSLTEHGRIPHLCDNTFQSNSPSDSLPCNPSPYESPPTPHHGPGHPCSCQCSSSDWLQTLHLFHYFCTTVWRSLSRGTQTEELWREALPKAALKHDFLMHGLLAVSALHYAHFHQDQRSEFHVISTHYHGLALANFRNRLNELNEENCDVFFLLASLIFTLSLCTVANPQGPRGFVTPDEVAQSFQLLQGVKCILDYKPLETWRSQGPWAPLFQRSVDYASPVSVASPSPAPVAPTPFETRIDKLFGLCRQLPRSLDVINAQSACLIALESLRSTHLECNTIRTTCEHPAHSWSWPLTIPQVFVDMLSTGHPVALVILAHYSALSWPFEHEHWASQGWSASIMGMVERVLEEDWQEWIVWPRKSLQEKIPVDNMTND